MLSHSRYSKTEPDVKLAFDANPKNKNLPEILATVCVLNDLYATRILDTFKMAEHIYGIEA